MSHASKQAPKAGRVPARVGSGGLVRALEFRPLLPDTPLLLRGYTTPDDTWVCTIDARSRDGLFGIHAGFEVGPKDDYFAEHLPSIDEAKTWAQQAWREIVGEWLCPNTPVRDAASPRSL